MIAHLRGSILDKHPNRIVIDVNGVGYEVFVPLSTFYGLGEPGTSTALRIHTHVREDAFLLYGFATQLEQDLPASISRPVDRALVARIAPLIRERIKLLSELSS